MQYRAIWGINQRKVQNTTLMAKKAQKRNETGIVGFIRSTDSPIIIQRNGIIRAVRVKIKKR